jgi:hypothetical protein
MRWGILPFKNEGSLSLPLLRGPVLKSISVFGTPDDTIESMEDTLALALEANCEFANFYCAMAYLGSKLYELAIENKWDLPYS